MRDKRVMLVTGVAGYWGASVARRLLEDGEFHLIGVDVEAPQPPIEGLDYVQADIRNPLLADLLRGEEVDTVCHLAFVQSQGRSEAAFDYNVMGTMKVVGAAAAAGVRSLVLKSSTMVYGAHPDNSAFIDEDAPLRGSRRFGYNRDRLEIEAFVNGFRRQAPEVKVAVLRFAPIVGPTSPSPFNRYLRTKAPPILLGFDPMMQVVHEDDVVAALAQAIGSNYAGVCNVAADGPFPLLRILALAGRTPFPLPHPLLYQGRRWLGANRFQRLCPLPPDYLRYRWTVDVTEMRDGLGFEPQIYADEAVENLGTHLRMKHYEARRKDIAYDEDRLRSIIERRRRTRATASRPEVETAEEERGHAEHA